MQMQAITAMIAEKKETVFAEMFLFAQNAEP